jgi:hypothetical protein
MGTRDRDLLLVTSLREKLQAAAAGGGAGAGYAGSRKGPRAEDVVKLFETIAQARPSPLHPACSRCCSGRCCRALLLLSWWRGAWW